MLDFKYTKANGDVSDRKLVCLRRPGNAYFGIDVTDVERTTTRQLQGLLKRHQRELDNFLAEKELTRNYRTFLTEGVEFNNG